MPLLDAFDAEFVASALASGRLNETRTGITPLWHAVYFGEVDAVTRLLDAGARVDAHDAAAIAASRSREFVIETYETYAPGPREVPTGASSLVHAAVARAKAPQMLELLLARGLDINARDRNGSTPLHLAVSRGEVALVDALLGAGADTNVRDTRGSMPLDVAHAPAMVDRLLTKGADPNGGGEYLGVFGRAAYTNDTKTLAKLLAAGADPRRHPRALHAAGKQRAEAAMRLLLKHGALLDTLDEGRTVLGSAAEGGSLACVELALASCKDQLDDGVARAIAAAHNDGGDDARVSERRRVIERLIELGANASKGLVSACASLDAQWYALLLRSGGDPRNAGVSLEDLLLGAARAGHVDAVKHLLATGADARGRDPWDQTAYAVAEASGSQGARTVMRLLAAAGGGPTKAPVAPAPVAPSTEVVGARVSHVKFGAGTVTAITDGMWTVSFADGARTLLPKFLTRV